eukprot:COSAG04_NODE_51_length_31064_cov_38.384789_6_plen_48_part_00
MASTEPKKEVTDWAPTDSSSVCIRDRCLVGVEPGGWSAAEVLRSARI